MSAKDVLSQEEIDALLDKADTIAAAHVPPHLRDEVEPYDIFKPPPMRASHLPDVSPIVDSVIEFLGSGLDAPLPKLLKIRPGPDAELIRFEEFRQTLETPCAILTHALTKPLHAMLFALNTAGVKSLVSAQFGGDGAPSIGASTLSSIECRVAGKLLTRLADLMTQVDAATGIVRESLTHPANLAGPADDDSMLIVRFELEIGAGGGELIMAGTSSAMTRILGSRKSAPSRDTEQWQAQLFARTSEALLTVCGRAAQARMDIGELLRLAPGDFIPMDIDRSVTLCVDELPLMRGLLGVSGAVTAVHIEGPANHPEAVNIRFPETITTEF